MLEQWEGGSREAAFALCVPYLGPSSPVTLGDLRSVRDGQSSLGE